MSQLFMIEFVYEGVATLKVRVPGKTYGGRLITMQSKLDISAEDLYQEIATKLNIDAKK